MRMLFVSGTLIGGSAQTTHELSRRLLSRGHDVASLMRVEDRQVRNYLYRRQVNLTTKLDGRVPVAPMLAIQRQMGRWPSTAERSFGYPVFTSTFPENAVPTLLRRLRPDVVVVSSIDRVAWRRIRAYCAGHVVPTVLYMRGVSCLGHLEISHAPPDLVMSNTGSVADRARQLGFQCVMVPSVVETDRCRVDSTREVVLLVNPIELLGVETGWALAERRSDVPFVFQQSWPLSRDERREIENRAAGLGNVEFRPLEEDARQVYRDARLLLAPHRVDNRPRVALEAQSNGIPVIASDLPGLVEAVGEGGIVVDPDGPVTAWEGALSKLWDDSAACASYSERARLHSGRPEVDPDHIVETFEETLRDLVNRLGQRPDNPAAAGRGLS